MDACLDVLDSMWVVGDPHNEFGYILEALGKGLKQYLKNLFKSIHLIFFNKLNIRFYIQSISLTRFLTFALVHSTRVCYDHL